MRRRVRHDDGGLIDVELVDVAADDARAAAPGLRARLDLTAAPLPADAVRNAQLVLDEPVRPRHVARAIGLGVVVVLVGAVVAINVSEARREAQLRAALEDAPGMLEPLGLIPDVLWTTPATEVVVLDAGTGVALRAVRMPGCLIDQVERDDDALTALAQPDGHVTVVRWDIATGTERWAPTAVRNGSCRRTRAA